MARCRNAGAPIFWTRGTDGNATGLRGDRYELWVYRQIRKRLVAGEACLDDSIRHRRCSDERVTPDQKADALKDMDIPWLRQPPEATLDTLFADLDRPWRAFDHELRQGKLKHLEYDPLRKALSWRKPKAGKEATRQAGFYAKPPARDIAGIFRLVDGRRHSLSALAPRQPRHAKEVADGDSLVAAIFARAMNHGNPSMAETSDIPYHILEATHRQCLRLSTCGRQTTGSAVSSPGSASSRIARLTWKFSYGSVDGQKFESASPTVKARHSRKHFGKGKGVVAYTLLANHIPSQTELIGANGHESHFVFDICYNNTSDILPTVATGGPAQYPHCLIRPAGQIDRHLIAEEKGRIDQIVATLGL